MSGIQDQGVDGVRQSGIDNEEEGDDQAEVTVNKTSQAGAKDPNANEDGEKVRSTPRQEAIKNLEMILDIPLEVSVELGRRRMPIHELLKLNQGSVVELSKLAGEPLDILVNRKLVARGEAVVVNEKFGVRLTDIVSPNERIEKITSRKEDEQWSHS